MDDIKLTEENYDFRYRSSGIIYNNDKTKILLFKSENRNFYMLPGGKVNKLESSEKTLKREIKEETGLNINITCFKTFSESLVTENGKTHQQVDAIYEAVYNKEIENDEFISLEGKFISFKWFNIKDINKINIEPSKIKFIIKGQTINHIEDGFK